MCSCFIFVSLFRFFLFFFNLACFRCAKAAILQEETVQEGNRSTGGSLTMRTSHYDMLGQVSCGIWSEMLLIQCQSPLIDHFSFIFDRKIIILRLTRDVQGSIFFYFNSTDETRHIFVSHDREIWKVISWYTYKITPFTQLSLKIRKIKQYLFLLDN